MENAGFTVPGNDEETRQECANLVARFAAMRALPEHPGWAVLMDFLDDEIGVCQRRLGEIMDKIVLSEDPEHKKVYLDTKIRLLSWRKAKDVYEEVRSAARNAQNYLDKVQANRP
jgi:hypothetical protein